MNRIALLLASILAASLMQSAALAGPEQDRIAFVKYFQSRFPDVQFDEFANGIYAIDEDSRRQWQEEEVILLGEYIESKNYYRMEYKTFAKQRGMDEEDGVLLMLAGESK